jgi:hypothetical protein
MACHMVGRWQQAVAQQAWASRVVRYATRMMMTEFVSRMTLEDEEKDAMAGGRPVLASVGAVPVSD